MRRNRSMGCTQYFGLSHIVAHACSMLEIVFEGCVRERMHT